MNGITLKKKMEDVKIDYLYNKGIDAFNKHKYYDAFVIFSVIIELNPNFKDSQIKLEQSKNKTKLNLQELINLNKEKTTFVKNDIILTAKRLLNLDKVIIHVMTTTSIADSNLAYDYQSDICDHVFHQKLFDYLDLFMTDSLLIEWKNVISSTSLSGEGWWENPYIAEPKFQIVEEKDSTAVVKINLEKLIEAQQEWVYQIDYDKDKIKNVSRSFFEKQVLPFLGEPTYDYKQKFVLTLSLIKIKGQWKISKSDSEILETFIVKKRKGSN